LVEEYRDIPDEWVTPLLEDFIMEIMHGLNDEELNHPEWIREFQGDTHIKRWSREQLKKRGLLLLSGFSKAQKELSNDSSSQLRGLGVSTTTPTKKRSISESSLSPQHSSSSSSKEDTTPQKQQQQQQMDQIEDDKSQFTIRISITLLRFWLGHLDHFGERLLSLWKEVYLIFVKLNS